jgi:parvulin-like peptidyl-prolyl isomerase
MRKIVPFLALVVALPVAACDSFGQAMTAHTDVVARAAGHDLSVDKASSMLIANPRLPAQEQVVDALANLWIDYTLLATATDKDSTLKQLDLQQLVKPALEQEMVMKLRDKVIKVDTTLSDAELMKIYQTEQPGAQVRARHILIRLAADATPAQRDSVLKLIKLVHDKATAPGADFAALAKQYSQDGSASQGGDLGFFGKGQMVKPFEEAAFKLQPGQVSDVVESPFGYHIIKVEEKKLPPFNEMKGQYKQQALQAKQQAAEEAYVKSLTDTMAIKLEEGAVAAAKDLAKKPDVKLGGRAASKALATYKGGEVTASEFQELMRGLPAQRREAFAAATDEQLGSVLLGLGRNEILIAEARKLGFQPTQTKVDSVAELARTQLKGAISSLGLNVIKPAQGETKDQALEKKVDNMLQAIVKGEASPLPLGPLAYVLREKYGGEVFEKTFPAVVLKVTAARPKAPVATPGMPPVGQPQGKTPPAASELKPPAPKPGPKAKN